MPARCAACMAAASVATSSAAAPAGLGRPVEAVGEAPPFEQLERDEGAAVGLADIVDLDDVGMAEPGDGLGLDPEPRELLGLDVLAVAGSSSSATGRFSAPARLVDDAHAAATQISPIS